MPVWRSGVRNSLLSKAVVLQPFASHPHRAFSKLRVWCTLSNEAPTKVPTIVLHLLPSSATPGVAAVEYLDEPTTRAIMMPEQPFLERVFSLLPKLAGEICAEPRADVTTSNIRQALDKDFENQLLDTLDFCCRIFGHSGLLQMQEALRIVECAVHAKQDASPGQTQRLLGRESREVRSDQAHHQDPLGADMACELTLTSPAHPVAMHKRRS